MGVGKVLLGLWKKVVETICNNALGKVLEKMS